MILLWIVVGITDLGWINKITMAALFVLTFVVYFFNLDMKLTAALEPLFLKHYDKIKRDRHL